MLRALDLFTRKEPYTLPLSPKLPDIKSDTVNYIHLQGLYKAQANAEKAGFTRILQEVAAKTGVAPIPSNIVDEFVRNCHQLKILKGKQWGDDDDAALRAFCSDLNCGFIADHPNA
jgi:NEDD8-activating enzyme E1 regulatory subunit